jgi:hypothetical protein
MKNSIVKVMAANGINIVAGLAKTSWRNEMKMANMCGNG